MSRASTCDNPRCTCSPCKCDDCKCGKGTLGDLEWRVMEVLWSQPASEMTGRQVADELSEYAYTTVATVLDRLSHKKMVHRRLVGRTVRFTAARTQAGYSASLMQSALGAAQDPDATLAQFAGTMSPTQAKALRRALGESSKKA